jgi:hypothetical protein
MDDKANELALQAMQHLGSGVFKIYSPLDIARPETINNFTKFGEVLHAAYKQGAAEAAVCTRSRPHEDMNDACKRKTVEARADYRAAIALKGKPEVPESRSALTWKSLGKEARLTQLLSIVDDRQTARFFGNFAKAPVAAKPGLAVDTLEFRALSLTYAQAIMHGSVPQSSKAWAAMVANIEQVVARALEEGKRFGWDSCAKLSQEIIRMKDAAAQTQAQTAEQGQASPVECGACLGSGWVVRDADIGTDQECFSCGGSGVDEEGDISQSIFENGGVLAESMKNGTQAELSVSAANFQDWYTGISIEGDMKYNTRRACDAQAQEPSAISAQSTAPPSARPGVCVPEIILTNGFTSEIRCISITTSTKQTNLAN